MSTDIEIGYDFYGKNLNVKTIDKLTRHYIRSYFIVDIFQEYQLCITLYVRELYI